jgi:hypothetical protein
MATESEIKLPRSEWDFRSIPKEEQWIAAIYEYCREIPEVKKRITVWLDGDLMVPCDDYDHFGKKVFENGLSPQAVTVRESLKREADGKPELHWDEQWAPAKIWNHKIWTIRHTLTEWPKPYVIAMHCDLVKQGIERTLEGFPSEEPRVALSPLGQLRASNREACELPKRFEGLTVSRTPNLIGLPTYGFDIDMNADLEEIKTAFVDWLEIEHAKPIEGRPEPKSTVITPGRPEGRDPGNDLVALSALRLREEGKTGEKPTFKWIKSALDAHNERTANVSYPGDTLPLLSPEKGLGGAVKRARKILMEYQ